MVRRHWISFQNVFAPLGFKAFFEKFDYLKFIRNHVAHVNDRFLSTDNREKANDYLCTLNNIVDKWMKLNESTPLIIKRSIRLTPGMRCEGMVVMMEGMSQPQIKGDFPFILNVEDNSCTSLTHESMVVFTVGGRPNPKGGTYFYACDITVIE